MLKISLYHDFCVTLHVHINPYRYRKDQLFFPLKKYLMKFNNRLPICKPRADISTEKRPIFAAG